MTDLLAGLRCPICARAVDDATPVGHHREPKPDDVAVCLYCAAVLIYDGAPLRLRLPRGPERAELYGDEQIAKVRGAVRARIATSSRGLQ